MKKILSVFLLIIWLSVNIAFGAEKSIQKALLISSFVPGGGYFYLGDFGTGCVFLLSEASLFLGGFLVHNKLEKGELNIFYLHALEIHQLQIFGSYQKARILNNTPYNNPVDSTPIHKLVGAPFKWKNIKSPYVYGFCLFGIGINVIEAVLNKNRKGYKDISNIQIVGAEFSRNAGSAIYTGLWIPISLNAALSEECLWRGCIQSEMENILDKKRGLILTSLLFGAGHISKPRELKYWAYGGIASLCGLYLGWLYQKNDYMLEQSIAAHFWFNLSAGITLFLIDPANNPLGVKVNFSFN